MPVTLPFFLGSVVVVVVFPTFALQEQTGWVIPKFFTLMIVHVSATL